MTAEKPPLDKIRNRVAKLEADQAEILPLWKAVLEQAGGNVTRAAEIERERNPKMNRDRAQWLTRRLGLVQYAAELRGQKTGRPRTKTSVDKKSKHL